MKEKARLALLAFAFFAGSLAVYLYNLPYRVWGAGGDTTPAEMLPLALMRNHDLVFDGLQQPDPKAWWFHDVRGHIEAGFAAFKGHLSYLPHSGSVIPRLAEETEGYASTKGSLHFSIDRPLPRALVRKLLATRMAEAFDQR